MLVQQVLLLSGFGMCSVLLQVGWRSNHKLDLLSQVSSVQGQGLGPTTEGQVRCGSRRTNDCDTEMGFSVHATLYK